ncbi:XRE family transcriptional regulator [Marinimicrobium sp. ABcell2]|uniref:helix-turn-helix domain-containing protein n=1 Tax=Marinimicrobium sp. ABcell2 TaxID=3069751 RepID=UPI0027AF5B8D|nr:XRE family transcriptional regulator [Marinimicrobium sp. ABcell2]MDQ2077501.1 XRE family transcriptional regulator [Marinimicrobium sp. ABcell2]
MTDKVKFNGDNLRIARLMSGISLNELGERVGNTRQYIHQLETSDKKVPTRELVEALAYELGVDSRFFCYSLGNQVKEEECHFRKLKTTLVSSRRESAARATLMNKLVERLEEYLELPPVNFPQIEVSTLSDSELASVEARKYWKLGDGPIKNMIRVAENAGAIVSTFGSISEKIDALSLNRGRPIIILNTTKSSARIRMDIGHEMLHIIGHNGIETGDRDTESQADQFASHFLLPRAALIREYTSRSKTRIDWNAIYSMKVKWGISARAIVYRLNQHGLITPSQYRTANIHFSKTGQTKEEFHDDKVSLDLPELLPSSLALLLETYGKTFGGLLSELGVKTEFLTNLTQTENSLLPLFEEINLPGNITSITAYKHAK